MGQPVSPLSSDVRVTFGAGTRASVAAEKPPSWLTTRETVRGDTPTWRATS